MTTRVFHPAPLEAGAEITLGSDESHYLLRVRRARVGDEVDVLDGVAIRMRARVRSADTAAATLQLLTADPIAATPDLTIAVGMPARPALLETLSRACELGATRVVLLETEHAAGYSLGLDRVARVLQAAQRQCGRPDVPRLEGPHPLAGWLDDHRGQGLIADPAGPTQAPRLETGPVAVLIGPEGGFTADEVGTAIAAGFARLALGPFVLRTEVAVVAAASRLVWPGN